MKINSLIFNLERVSASIFMPRSEHLIPHCVPLITPNEEFLISKVFMITFDLLAARDSSRAVSFPPPVHVFRFHLLAPPRPAHR